ncbi:tetratricopeptide repeat protein [Natrialbaceae archaeon A-CW2]
MDSTNRIEETEVLIKRLDVLKHLCRSSAYVRDLVEETEQSRSTINRAINELEAMELVERGNNGFEATTAGRFAHDRLTSFLHEFDDILVAKTVLDPVPAASSVGPEAVIGAKVIPASGPATYRPLERMLEDLAGANRYRALVPALEDARHVRLLYEHVVTEGKTAELVVAPEVFDTLRTDFSRQMAVMAEEDGFTVYVGSVPPVGLGLIERENGSRGTSTTTTHTLVLNESGGIHGLFVNEGDAAVRWAENRYEEYLSSATDRTGALAPDTDGGIQSENRQFVMPGRTLPASLEREGFVRVDESYFLDEPVADPPTAWRAGLSIAEVHTGYAVERLGPNGEEKPLRDDHTLSWGLTTTLASGKSSILVGPPGSGKSTTCKQVACEWYENGRGPVLYRESDRGHAFGSVDDLVSTVAAADGHTLVVVEDAIRPDANAVFDAIDRLADPDDVSFLLDSREHEWHDRDRRDRAEPSLAGHHLDVLHVPPIAEDDCSRLVDHFERTVRRPVDVSAERLWASVREESTTGEEGSHELLRLTHRLATYADPLADEPTALEDAVESVREDLVGDELALTVGTLTNTLIAAGIGIERGLLYAVAEPEAFDAIDEVIDRLEGDVLFVQENGGYRTIHEEWAMTYLTQVAEDGGAEASRRFRNAVTALLALRDDTERCERIASHLDDPTALEDVLTHSERWVADVLEAVFDLFYRRVTLAPLFGDGSHPPFDLPDGCSDSVSGKGPYWLGQRFLEAGDLDRGERAFERLSREDATARTQRLLGLGNIAYKRGEYDDAITHLEAGLALAQDRGDGISEFDYHRYLGLTNWRLGAYDDGRDHLETCIELARSLDAPWLEGKAQTALGGIAWAQGQYERARASNEFQIERARETGDLNGEATSINNLGVIARVLGAYDRATTRHEEALAIARDKGFRSIEAHCLNNLGHVASDRGSLQEATAFHKAALDIGREIDRATHCGESLWRLGAVAVDRGEYDEARQFLREADAVFEETGNRTYLTRITLTRARLALECGALQKAHDLTREAHGLADDLGAVNESAMCRQLLGRIALTKSDLDSAHEHWTDALEVFEERRMYDRALETLEYLVETCCDHGETDEAGRWYRHARNLVADAPNATATLHSKWIDTYREPLEQN